MQAKSRSVASQFASREMLRIIDGAFVPAPDYETGLTTLFHKLAKLFDLMGKWNGCPVSGILLSGAQNAIFRELSEQIFDTWITRTERHAIRLGIPEDEANDRATHLFVVLQGGWDLARAKQSSNILRDLPKYLK